MTSRDEEALDWAQGCLRTYKVGGPISCSIITAYLPKPQPPAEVVGAVEEAV